MNEPTPLSDLVADDLLLDALGRRADCGHDPLVSVLGALAAHADTPLVSGGLHRRRGSRKRLFTTFAVLAVGATGAGVAAAVTLPHGGAGHEAPEIYRPRPGVPAITTTQAAPLLAGVSDTGSGRWTVVSGPDGSVQVVPRTVSDSLAGAAPGSAPFVPGVVPGASGSSAPAPTGSKASTAPPKGPVDKTGRPVPSGDQSSAPGDKQSQPSDQEGSSDAPQSLVAPTKTAQLAAPRNTGSDPGPEGQSAQSAQAGARQAPTTGPAPSADEAPAAAQGRATAQDAVPAQAVAGVDAPRAGSSDSAPGEILNPAPAAIVPFLPTARMPQPVFLPYLPFPTGP